MSIALHTRLNRDNDILYAAVDKDEAVMMSIAADSYFGLNAVGIRIWELLEHPITVAGLCAQMCEEFDVDAKTCEAEVLKFVCDLLDNGVIHVATT